ncbi:hypothetical protein C1645_749763, partial [Glomus cerebriforme]
MDYNSPLHNNNTYPNNLQSPQMDKPLSNVYNSVNTFCDHTDHFPVADNNIINNII